MSIESRNKAALAAGQAAWDNASPDEESPHVEFVGRCVDDLMATGECSIVPFYSRRSFLSGNIDGFDVAAYEAICEADTHDCELVQLVLACLNGEHEKAQALAAYFEKPLRDAAEKLVSAALLRLADDQ